MIRRASCCSPALLWVALCALLATSTSQATSGWQGYLNDKGQSSDTYGYFESQTSNTGDTLRLTCHPPHGFRLYLPLSPESSPERLRAAFRTDKLPVISLPVYRQGQHYFVIDTSSGFWDLIAQMIAGVNLTLELANHKQTSYSLHGFYHAFNEYCGWIPGSDSYRQYISRYR